MTAAAFSIDVDSVITNFVSDDSCVVSRESRRSWQAAMPTSTTSIRHGHDRRPVELAANRESRVLAEHRSWSLRGRLPSAVLVRDVRTTLTSAPAAAAASLLTKPIPPLNALTSLITLASSGALVGGLSALAYCFSSQ